VINNNSGEIYFFLNYNKILRFSVNFINFVWAYYILQIKKAKPTNFAKKKNSRIETMLPTPFLGFVYRVWRDNIKSLLWFFIRRQNKKIALTAQPEFILVR